MRWRIRARAAIEEDLAHDRLSDLRRMTCGWYIGFDKLHFQAKRWKNQVGAKEIRDFIGGIQTAHHSEYGIFVTTSDFSKDAIETARKSGKVRLVNGKDLAGLMVEYGLGSLNRICM